MHHQNLWAPWRLAYIRSLEANTPGSGASSGATATTSTHTTIASPPPVCFLCDTVGHAPGSDGAIERLILLQDERGCVLMNRYPYVTAHLLVSPAAHVASLNDMTATDRAGLMELVAISEQLVRDAVNAQGVNIGINLGRAAGAGVPGHLHVHIVPRWAGDTNFMDVVGGVRVIPGALEEVYAHLRTVLGRRV